jgi:hypothetical protein
MDEVTTTQETAPEATDTNTVNNEPVDDDLIDAKAPAEATPTETMLADVYLSDELRKNPTIKNLEGKSVTDMAKMVIEGQKLVGADKFVVPGNDATPDEWTSIYKKLGRPDTPDAYNLKAIEDMPEGLMSEDRIKQFAQLAFDKGLSAMQANAILDFAKGNVKEDYDSVESRKEETLQVGRDTLMKDYGNAFQEKCALANSVLRNSPGGDEFREALKSAGLGNDPRVIKFLADTVGPTIGEDRLLGLDTARNRSGVNTPEEAQAKILELRKRDGFGVKGHPDEQSIKNEYIKLVEDAHPEQKSA